MTTDENQNDQSIGNLPIRQESGIKLLFGVSLLSIAVILFNLWLLISLLVNREEFLTGKELPIYQTPISLSYFILLCFTFTMAIVIGIIFWLGKSWGWWLFSFYCFLNLFGSIKPIILFAKKGDVFYIIRGTSFYVMAVCLLVIIISYLFGDSVFGYFDLNKNNKFRYGVYLAISAAIGVVLQIFWKA